LGEHGVLVERLGRALAAELPLFARDGGFIAPGYAFELDQYRELRDDSRRAIAQLQARYAEASGVASLRIRHNNVIGYYVEVSAANAGKLGVDFMHRQTMAGAMRYTTVELGELESKIASAAERALALELRLFEDLVGEIMARRQEIAAAAAALAALDLAAAHAECAIEGNWVRPEIDTGPGFEIRGGRHPTVEAALAGTGAFVANDCVLGEDRIWLVTGPNMAGKSTFFRQNALIAILAQIGAFVPATAPTASVSASSTACRPKLQRGPKRCCRSSKRANKPARWPASPTICRCSAPPVRCRPLRSRKPRRSRMRCARPAPTSSARAS